MGGAQHEAAPPRGAKRFHDPVAGDLALDFESLDLAGDPGQTLLVYTAEPNSPSQHALNLVASWTSTQELGVAVDAHEELSARPPRTEP